MPRNNLMRPCLIAVIVFIFALPITAQQPPLSGIVIDDSTGVPLARVYVAAYDGNKSTAYTYTDDNGTFSFPDGRNISAVSASLLGYKAAMQDISPGTQHMEIRLTPAKLQIQAASVRASVVEERGDTLSYTAQAFADGTERAVGELLEKLPGITVNPRTGTIYHNGQSINKFYVEGMDLMGNRYGVVTQNLASDKIARIEILQHHQPVQALQGLDPSASSAINIILKESARSSWALGVYASAGAPPLPLFSATAMLTRFAKRSQDLFLFKGNNLGGDILRELQEQQYFGRNARWFVVDTENMDADFASELRPARSELPLPRHYWYDNLSGLGTLNHLFKINEQTQVKLSLNGAAERYRENTRSKEEVRFSGQDALTIREDRSLQDTRYYVDLTASVEQNAGERYFRDEVRVAGQWRDALSALDRSRPYAQSYGLPSLKFQNLLQWTARLREEQAVTVTSASRFVRSAHTAEYTTADYDAVQALIVQDFRSENTAETILRTGRLRWTGTAGLDLAWSGTDTRLTGLEALGVPESAARFSVFSATPHLSLRTRFYLGRSEWTAALPARLSLIATGGRVRAVPSLSPSLSVSLRLSQAWEWSASTGYSRTHSDPESLLDAPVMQNWRTLAHRDSLRRTDVFRASTQLRYSNNPAMFYASLSGSLSRRRSDRVAAYTYSEFLTLRSYVPMNCNYGNYTLTGKVSKHFGARLFVVDLTGTAAWDDSDDILNRQPVHYRSRTLSGEVSLRLAPAAWISAEARANYARTDIFGSAPTRTRTLTAEGTLTVRPVRVLGIQLSGYGLWQQVPGTTVSNTPLLDASLSWRLGKHELVLECRNLLGCDEFSRETVSAWQRFSTVSKLRGRQFLLSFRASIR